MSDFTPPQQRASWHALQALALAPQPHLRELLSQSARATQMQAQGASITLDYARQRVTPEVLQALLDLAEESQVMTKAQALFRGEKINATEGRAVLHVALRGGEQIEQPWGQAISAQVAHELARVCAFAEQMRAGAHLGYTGQAITDVVNIGIGGSDLGPRMATEALGALASQQLRVHYVSNPDAWSLYATLAALNPERTAFVVQSKTFTTQETLTLLASAQRWLADAGCTREHIGRHLIAVTASSALAAQHGIPPEHIFGFWDWVGGRYSLWSAIGLPLAIAIGADAFRDLLAGGRAMDAHFMSAPPTHNLPLLLAVLGVWNRNFLQAPTHLISPYASPLAKFAPFIQQMDMESNGKRTHVDGSATQIGTGPIIWGGLGIDGQHAYFQLIHQGQHLVPVDFIGVRTEHTPLPLAAEHHRVVLMNLQAQAQALALGRDAQATVAELRASGLSEAEVARLTPHRSFAGNIPSSTLWLDELTPHSLGALIALYEHKVFCQAAIWGIHAFDQWGVELGKKMVTDLEAASRGASGV